MAEKFYTMLTKLGRKKLSASAVSGSKVNFKTLKVGDGNGSYYEPSEDQTSIVKEVWSGNISAISVDESNANWIVAETVIPAADGGFFIREAGIFDDAGDMIAITKLSETYKPTILEGSTKDLVIKIVLEVSNASSIDLKIDPNLVVATKGDIQILQSKFQEVSAKLSGKMQLYINETLPAIADRTSDTLYFKITDKITNGFADNVKVSPNMGIKIVQ
ncbi:MULTISPECIES: phage tail protein [Clostridium]|uniref:phage tail protein n=1 Tax=Clostridium TaxID=1485 RepID=UPI00041FD07A|nr:MULTISPECIES: phage tail protein [Clostridium]MBN7573667.1 phage tail protein [Clostridium beijerinckii]MBN7578919.1 phage tail protein [Clostridium beijerinckii]MBN7583298.1 phage tail protein [Clostridium beijerinckii]MBO0521224.1 phage tail protein [Clostridium beijerinckii]MZK52624.1 phage tail protein [Clostridium beijerinckii]